MEKDFETRSEHGLQVLKFHRAYAGPERDPTASVRELLADVLACVDRKGDTLDLDAAVAEARVIAGAWRN